MNKNYKLGDSVSLVAVKFTSMENESVKLTHVIPNANGVDRTPYESIFPYESHKSVNAEIYFYDIIIIDVFHQENGTDLYVAANKDLDTVKYQLNKDKKYVLTQDKKLFANQFTLSNTPNIPADDPRSFIWLKDDGSHVIDMDYIEFLIIENQKWDQDKTYRLDQEFFNLLTGFLDTKTERLMQTDTPLLTPIELSKTGEKEFNTIKNKVGDGINQKACALISQLVLPDSVNHNVFLKHVKEEILSAYPFKRDLTENDIGIYYEKKSVPLHSLEDNSWKTRAEVKIIIFTTLYNRLQSSIVGKRSPGTLAEKLMESWANALFDLGVNEKEIQLNLYLNYRRHLIINNFNSSIYEIYNNAVLPINDQTNWRNKIEGFIKFANYANGNKSVNLCCLKLKLRLDASLIPSEAMLRLRAELKCEYDSDVLRINDGKTLYLFCTFRCVKARLKSNGEVKSESARLTDYVKNLFKEKMNFNYAIEDHFTIFNLYSDVDIANVYESIINRDNLQGYIKPSLIIA